MADDATAGASEDASAGQGTAAAGSTDDGSAGGGGASAGAGSSGVDWQARARTEQGRADRLQSQIDAAAASAGTSGPVTPPATQDSGEAPQYLTQSDFIALQGRMEEMRETRDSLRTEFPSVDPSLFRNYLDNDSPEAFRAKVEDAAQGVADLEKRIGEQKDKEWLERLGPLAKQFETPAAGSGTGTEGAMTLERYMALSFDAKDAAYRADPEGIDRLLDAATG